MRSDLPFFVKKYFRLMDDFPHRFCDDQWNLRENVVIPAFSSGEIYTDDELARSYFGLARYFPFERIFEWEEYILGLHLCTFWKSTGMPRWPDLFAMIGRGAGKDGVISLESLALISPYNPIQEYDVDICANNEDQATRPVKDIVTALDANKAKMRKFFYWTQERILGKKRHSYIKGHTNNAKGKDGLRSGVVIFNEYHQYENYANVDVFTTGLGKKEHPRRSIYTTNGNVVDGPLDELIKDSEDILKGDVPDNGLLPFICRINSMDLIDDEEAWHQANPSLMYRPSLMEEIRKEYREWKKNPARLPAFPTKRMNRRQGNNELPVAEWSDIAATNLDIPNLKGQECVVGIDFTKTSDWAAVNAHFKRGEERYDINHAWICMQSEDLHRLKCPFQDWAEKGYATLVYEPEINPQLLVDYIMGLYKMYRIKMIAADSYRFTLLSDYLAKIGFCAENKNIMMVRPSDIMKTYPIIDRCFKNHFFHWGEAPHLRWATNNCKLVRATRSKLAQSGEIDVGNYLIGKIEPKSRKTDPFMALVASMCCEGKLKEIGSATIPNRKLKTIVFR